MKKILLAVVMLAMLTSICWGMSDSHKDRLSELANMQYQLAVRMPNTTVTFVDEPRGCLNVVGPCGTIVLITTGVFDTFNEFDDTKGMLERYQTLKSGACKEKDWPWITLHMFDQVAERFVADDGTMGSTNVYKLSMCNE